MKMLKNKILELEPERALFILGILSALHRQKKCKFYFAGVEGITHDEWQKSNHFFLCPASAKILEKVKAELRKKQNQKEPMEVLRLF